MDDHSGTTADRSALNRSKLARETLDIADQQMIELLNDNGRISNRQIAAAVGLTEVTVAARIRALIDKRILGVSTVFDWRAAGYLFDVWVWICVGDRPVREVAAELAKQPSIHSVHIVFGNADIIIHALLAGNEEVADFLARDLRPIPGIDRIYPALALRTFKYNVNFARMPIEPTHFDFPSPVVELDDMDRAILAALALDGRRSNRDLARELEMSDSTVRLRIRRMEQAGLLRIAGQTDPYLTKAADAWTYVGLEVSGDSSSVARSLAERPEVGIVAEVSGPFQLLVLVITAERSSLIEFVLDQLRAQPGVRSSRSWEIINTTRLDYHWGRF
ncbi:Lrp/AsnC family transcriptional regulator [Rhodococcus aetherivorans]